MSGCQYISVMKKLHTFSINYWTNSLLTYFPPHCPSKAAFCRFKLNLKVNQMKVLEFLIEMENLVI